MRIKPRRLIRNYLENGAPKIDGWLHVVSGMMIPLLDMAQKQMNVGGDIAEIGVWRGKTLALFSLMVQKAERVFGYDIELKPDLMENLREHARPGKVVLNQGDSTQLHAWDLFRTKRRLRDLMRPKPCFDRYSYQGFRMFHVDGYHTFEVAKSDLRLAAHVTRPDGIIFLDDFFSVTVPGVTQALFHLMERNELNGFVPFALGGSKAYLCQVDHVARYRDWLFEHMPIAPLNGQDVDCMCGHRLAIYQLW